MPSFPYDRDFLPLLKVGDYVYFQGQGRSLAPKNGEGGVFQVQMLEPIQPYMIDTLQISGALPTSVTALAANGSVNDRTGVIPQSTINNILQLDNNVFAQYRVTLLDDILFQLLMPGAGNPLYSTPNASTYIQNPLAPHKSKVQITTAPGTDSLIWANSSNVDLAAGIAGQTPTRHSRIVGLNIQCSGATNVFLGDASAAGGTAATSANSELAFSFSAADWTSLGRDSLPQDLYFNSGVVCQQSAAVTTNITVIVEEDDAAIFSGEVVDRSKAIVNNNAEFFVLEDLSPAMRIINPLSVAQSSARVIFAGFQYVLGNRVTPPAGIRPTQIPIASVTHSGPVNVGTASI